ncbi:MAG: NAD-dependent epimerase/dehydratase family protein [Microscillaceae bacterium]|jgi:nucleoside-diphosphate-sugar epimerase|nr:NAD-dependent epimerase/dehydratase family protein [Microscillaceae bacterium]
MKKAFVTGGTGFLGLNLVEILCAEGWEVYALHRKSSNLKYLERFSVKLVEGSIRDAQSLQKALPKQVDAFFHVAGNTNLWYRGNAEQYEDNVVGTGNVVQACLQNEAQKLVVTSSVSAFGVHDGRIDETTPSNAESYFVNYNRTKYLAEREVDEGVKNGLAATILNPCQIVGKYDQNSWAQLIRGVYRKNLPGIPPGGGSFCHAQAVARAHINAVAQGRVGERYLLGGAEVSYLIFINALQKILAREPYHRATPIWALRLVKWVNQMKGWLSNEEPTITPEKYEFLIRGIQVDDSKARRELAYLPSDLEVMLRESFEWLEAENLL